MSTYQNVHTLHTTGDPVAQRETLEPTQQDRNINDVFSYLGELFGRLTTDLSELFSLHKDLLKEEVRDSAKVLARDSAMLIIAAVLGWFAFAGLTLALIALVAGLLPIDSGFMAAAAGAAIVGVLYAVIAGALAMAGIKHLQKKSLAPDRTLQEIKRDKEAVKEIR